MNKSNEHKTRKLNEKQRKWDYEQIHREKEKAIQDLWKIESNCIFEHSERSTSTADYIQSRA